MRIYTDYEEENVKARSAIREWVASGLLHAQQADVLQRETDPGVETTRTWFRAALFLFTFGVSAAFMMLLHILRLFPVSTEGRMLAWGAISYGLAEYAVRRGTRNRKLYRSGVEEALTVSSVFWLGIGLHMIWMPLFDRFWAGIVSLVLAGLWLLVYGRFGYLYAVFAALVTAASGLSLLSSSNTVARILISLLFLVAWGAAGIQSAERKADYRRDELHVIEAMCALGLYLALNLRLTTASLFRFSSYVAEGTLGYGAAFYWMTYALCFMLSAAMLLLAIRRKQRPLLSVAILTMLLTLVTNKPYLGWVRHEWDPIILGTFLIALTVTIRRWLVSAPGRERSGFTPERLLSRDKSALSALGSASALWSGGASGTASPSKPDFGDGRSGGGGAQGTY